MIMPVSTLTKSVFFLIVLLCQIYLVYAATLYVDIHSSSFLWVVATAVICAVASPYYIFVVLDKDDVGGDKSCFSENVEPW
jgi:hypothetical protein